jgi:hypothetical protein
VYGRSPRNQRPKDGEKHMQNPRKFNQKIEYLTAICQLHNLYNFSNIFRVIKGRRKKWAGHVPLMGEMRNVYKILVGKPEGK